MEVLRMATKKDKKTFYDLWKICFGDSDAFCNWFFDHRFLPDYAVCLEVDGRVVSCMQAFPIRLNIRGKGIDGAILAGVSTHPNYRKRGYMGQIFPYMLQVLREKGILVAIHTPAVLSSYFSFGHYPVCKANFFTGRTNRFFSEKNMKTYLGFPIPLEELQSCYSKYAKKYSGIVDRTKENFSLKAADYFSDGGQCVAVFEKGKVEGYAFYYETKEELVAPEVVCCENQKFPVLLESLMGIAKGKKMTAKLPPQIKGDVLLGENNIMEKGVAGGLDLPTLLRIFFGVKGYIIAIDKDILSENIGIFDGVGNKSDQPPDLQIEGGALTQLLFGYKSLNQLVSEQKAIILTEKGKNLTRILKTELCFVIDEY